MPTVYTRPNKHYPQVDPKNCRAHVFPRWNVNHPGYQCTRLGKIERDGKLWCKTHDPAAEALRVEAEEAQDQYRQDFLIWEREHNRRRDNIVKLAVAFRPLVGSACVTTAVDAYNEHLAVKPVMPGGTS